MKYICFTEVDAATRVVCTDAPMQTGPDFPRVEGLQIIWANESSWPIPCNPDGSYQIAPRYYGTCGDDADINISGVIEVISEADFNQLKRDEFFARRHYPSWTFDEETLLWCPPIPYPEDGNKYRWDEETTSWVLLG